MAFFQGDHDRAARLLEESLAVSRAIGDRLGEARALSNLGENAREKGDFEAALACDERAAAIFEELGAQQEYAIPMLNQGLSLLGLGRLDEARRALRRSLAVTLEIGAVPFVLSALSAYARLFFAEGRSEEAVELLGLALGHPSTTVDIRREADRLFAEMGGGMDADSRRTILDRGGRRVLEEVARKLLSGGGP